jgi:energy-coupling factor transporter ATP-binding protein EcfA2
MKVRNMTGRSGQPVKNQFIIEDGKSTIFQSYNSIIAMKSGGRTYLDKYRWDYSTTTGKYRNQFLGMNKKQIEQAIEDGAIYLVDLNDE